MGGRGEVGRLVHLPFLVVLLVCAIYSALRTAQLLPAPIALDDAYIYLRVVANLLATGRPEFNAGDPRLVVTSPLWTGLLAAAQAALPFLDPASVAKALWLFCLGAASVFAYLAWRPQLRGWSAFLPVPFFLSPLIASMMGTEVALLYAALFATLLAHLRSKAVITGIALGLAYLCRGEAALLVVPIVVSRVWAGRRSAGPRRRTTLRYLLRLLAGAGAIALLWHLYSLAAFGSFFPETLRTKILQGRSGEWHLYHVYLGYYVRELLGGRLYLLALAALGLAWRPSAFLYLGSFTLLHILAYAWLGVPSYHWYYYDVDLVVLLAVVFGSFRAIELLARGLGWLADRWPRVKRPRWLGRALSPIAFLAFALWLFPIRAAIVTGAGGTGDVYVDSRETRFLLQRERYESYSALAGRLAPELEPGDVVLTPEVGILSYLLRGQEIRDVNGLASPVASEAEINDYALFVERYRPRYLVLPWGGGPATKTYERGGQVFTYERDFVAAPRSRHFPGDVYRLADATRGAAD